jgi:putative Ca2+/H+ antiporter (TMEM165/GDT1 family)
MTTVDEIAFVATSSTGAQRWPWWLLRVVTALATLSAFIQAVLAGGIVAGRIEALPLHSANGLLLAMVNVVLLVALVLAWRPGGGPVWTLFAGLLLAVATMVQLGLGFSPSLAVHVPLGTTVIFAVLMLLVWAWQRPLPEDRG